MMNETNKIIENKPYDYMAEFYAGKSSDYLKKDYIARCKIIKELITRRNQTGYNDDFRYINAHHRMNITIHRELLKRGE